MTTLSKAPLAPLLDRLFAADEASMAALRQQADRASPEELRGPHDE